MAYHFLFKGKNFRNKNLVLIIIFSISGTEQQYKPATTVILDRYQDWNMEHQDAKKDNYNRQG